MANKSFFRIKKKPPAAAVQMKEVRDEVRRGLDNYAKMTTAEFQKIVANWRNRPTFKYRVGSGSKELYVRIYSTGSPKAKQLWRWIDKTGTRPHTIRAKNGGRLAFNWNGPGSYRAKTTIGPAGYGGPGRVIGGKTIFAREVKHPGFRARRFSAQIIKASRKELDRQIYNGYRRGLYRAKKARG